MEKIRIMIINGANLDMLGRRSAIYGDFSLSELNEELAAFAKDYGAGLEFFQSNYEGAIIEQIHKLTAGYDGLIINAGAFSHYSYAIRDALELLPINKIEVHLTDLSAREDFRHRLVLSPVCDEVITGKGRAGYEEAIVKIAQNAQKRRELLRKSNLILIGMMGAGKSSVAKALSDDLGLALYDLDQMFKERFGSIEAAFAAGEEAFRQKEGFLMEELAGRLTPSSGAVIAVGGGGVLLDSFSALKKMGRVIYLMAKVDKLLLRVEGDSAPRPLKGQLVELYERRKGLYEANAQITIDTTHLGIEEVVARIKYS